MKAATKAVLLAVLCYSAVSCSTVRLSYEAELQRTDTKEEGTFRYRRSYDVSGHKWACIITGIAYGGWCWAYLGMPFESQEAQLRADAEGSLKDQLHGLPVTKKSEATSKDSWELAEVYSHVSSNLLSAGTTNVPAQPAPSESKPAPQPKAMPLPPRNRNAKTLVQAKPKSQHQAPTAEVPSKPKPACMTVKWDWIEQRYGKILRWRKRTGDDGRPVLQGNRDDESIDVTLVGPSGSVCQAGLVLNLKGLSDDQQQALVMMLPQFLYDVAPECSGKGQKWLAKQIKQYGSEKVANLETTIEGRKLKLSLVNGTIVVLRVLTEGEK